MSDVPVPGTLQDFFKACVLGRPTQFAANFFRTGYQDRRIAGAARRVQERNVAAGDARCGGDDFANAEAGTVAEIVDMTIRSIERLKDRKVSHGEIVDMDEVADACSIRSRIVGSEDGNRAGGAESGAQNVGNEMGLGFVMLPVAVPCAGGVEITENGETKPVDAVKPVEHDFGLQLGLAIGICGTLGSGFWDRAGIGYSKDGAGGRKNKF